LQVMAVSTVFLVGIDQLAQIPEFLNMGAVVVVAPDPRTLRRWRWEQDGEAPTPRDKEASQTGLVVDIARRRISSLGLPIDLSDLEFRVLAALLAEPRPALCYRDLRRIGWGDGPQLPLDAYSVRSLIQRLRAKLKAVRAPLTICAIRGFGFRAEPLVKSQQHSVTLGTPARRPI
jgi:DNA-binding response OmpR family regulator